jgi:predicted alpha-1,2-mannosidase
VSLSPISVEQAGKDGQQQLANHSFEQIRQRAREQWSRVLEKVRVSGNETYKKIFYTHLYHSYLAPFNLTSADGTYQSANGQVYPARDYTYYYGWAIWDNFRTQLPLLSLLEPRISRDIGKSLVSLYGQGKHDWPVDTEPYLNVRTEHALIVLLDLYRKGLLAASDLQKAYGAIKEESKAFPFSGHGGNKAPALDSYLEMSYDEWGIAQLAKALKQEKDHTYYRTKSGQYKKVWDQHFKVMGDSSDIIEAKGLYEGTYWQYRWFVPHDVAGIISMLGGPDEFARQLAYFFDNNLYNHANQPDIQAPFMFHFAGKPWLTQKYVNQILTKEMVQRYGPHAMFEKPYVGKVYKATPDGYVPEMDDDVGTMSAWYMLGAMGIYPACVGEPYYLLNAPLFEQITLRLENGKTFAIEAKNLSEQNFYIQ